MKKITTLLLFTLCTLYVNAQLVKNPVSWSIEAEETSDGMTELHIKAEIGEHWQLYSTDFDPDLGPMITLFTIQKSDEYEIVGKIKPVDPLKKFDELWGGDYTYFMNKGEFIQTIKPTGKEYSVKMKCEYQVCSEVDGRCIPYEQEITYSTGPTK